MTGRELREHRRELREHCFKMLFCADFYPAGETGQQFVNYFEAPEEEEAGEAGENVTLHAVEDISMEDMNYLVKKAEAVTARIPELDQKIDSVAEGWKTKRMGKVDLTILRLALYEMLYDDEIPERVAINEAVELPKRFGQNESPSFVNGVLAKLV